CAASGTWAALLAAKRLQGCCRAGAQECHVAADGEKTYAALAERHRTLGSVTIGSHDLAGLVGGGDDLLELALDLAGHGIDIGALAECDGEIGGSEEQCGNSRRCRSPLDAVGRGFGRAP